MNPNLSINAYELSPQSDPNKTNVEINANLFSNIDFGPLKMYLDDDNITDISYSNNGQMWLKSLDKGVYRVDNPGINNELMEKIAFQCANIMGKTFNMASPFLDSESTELRMNFVHDSIARNGIAAVFRKTPAKIRLKKEKIIEEQYITHGIHDFLIECVKGHCNIIVSGETGSGKTELVKYLASHTKESEKIITIEDTLELQIPHEHVIRMETRPSNTENRGELTMNDLVKNSLRQRPDRIIVGEVRANEAITLFTALNTGHSGFGTLHSNDARETITRLTNDPMSVPEIMITAIDFIIMQNRIYRPDGVSYRRISEVAEVVGIEEGTVQLNKIFEWNPESDKIENVSIASKTLTEIAKLTGQTLNDLYKEIGNRQLVLEHMINKDIRSVEGVQAVLELYYKNPQNVLSQIIKGQ